jgi:gliding motility-associated-like protein
MVRETIDSTGCDSTTAAFNVSIWEVADVVVTCQGDTSQYLDDHCEFSIPDFTGLASVDNNCGPDPVITQIPVAGTMISGSGTVQEIVLLATFEGGHESGCGFNVLLQDTILPGVLSLRDTTVMVEEGIIETFITMPLPGFIDNCGIQSIINDFNGGPDASGNYPLDTTNVVYTVTDVSDNSEQFNQQVMVQSENEPEWELIIPEGFSPNEDGLNDRFEILGIEQYPDNELRIFNVHGNEVYRMANYDNSWDGTSASNLNRGGKLPTGTYYYVLNLGMGNTVIKGFVYLRRE